MNKEEFRELEKQNAYINNLLEVAKEANVVKLNDFFLPLNEILHKRGFLVCAHFHYDPIRITVYDGTEETSQYLTIVGFEVVDKSDNFDPVTLDLVEIWLRDLK